MSGELTDVATEFFAALDAVDADRMTQPVAEDAQGIDEVGRRWLRGPGEVVRYIRELMGAVSGPRTKLRDPEERVWGDTGLLTCWIDQDYTLSGTPQHISAPTTLVFRRDGGAWKMVLFHSFPLPEHA